MKDMTKKQVMQEFKKKQEKPRTSADKIINKFKSPEILARMIDVDLSTIYRWTHTREKNGTGGCIPHTHHEAIVQAAKELGIEIVAEDLICVDL